MGYHPITMDSKLEIQNLHLKGHDYKLIVEISAPIGAQWQAVAVKDGKKSFGPKEYGSEAEAKNEVHQFAYYNAGINDHFCDGNCVPWKSS